MPYVQLTARDAARLEDLADAVMAPPEAIVAGLLDLAHADIELARRAARRRGTGTPEPRADTRGMRHRQDPGAPGHR